MDTIVLKDYLSFEEKSGYCLKTILNRLFALEQLCGFIEERLVILNNEGFTQLGKNNRTQAQLTKTIEWIGAQIESMSADAAEETRVRNCREAMEKENKWVDAGRIFTKEVELKPEIDALIERVSRVTEK